MKSEVEIVQSLNCPESKSIGVVPSRPESSGIVRSTSQLVKSEVFRSWKNQSSPPTSDDSDSKLVRLVVVGIGAHH